MTLTSGLYAGISKLKNKLVEKQDGGACTRSSFSLPRQNGVFVFFVL